MFYRLLLLSSLLSLSTAYLSQRSFCDSTVVVKAKLLPLGSIKAGEAPPAPDLPPYYRRFEIQIEEVFKSNMLPFLVALQRGAKYHAISRDTGENADADGCDFYQRAPYTDTILTAVLYFDTFSRIELKRTCKDWGSTTDFERNALREGKYNCGCKIEECVDRVTRKAGLPGCSRQDLVNIACDRDERGRCIWRGAKKTCVNPLGRRVMRYKGDKKLKQKL